MFWTVVVALLLLWVVGAVSSYTLGGFVHVFLVAAAVLVFVHVLQAAPRLT